MKEHNLNIVYEEITELHRIQQSGIDLVYNKFNWILVSDIVFLAALYNSHRPSVTVTILVSLSGILALLGIEPIKFKITAKVTDQLSSVEDENFLLDLIKTKKEALNKNQSRTVELNSVITYSKWLLIAAIVLQCLIF
jgi:hypothetical protein